MAEELQQLLEKIQRDGVDKANAEADAIIAKAKADAAAVAKAAADEAAATRAAAETDAKAYADRAAKTIAQAARDVILEVRQGVSNLFDSLLGEAVNSALANPDAVAGLALEAVKAAGSGAEIAAGENLAQALRAKLAQTAASGVTIVTDPATGAGFSVRLDNGRVEHDFSEAAIAAAIAKRLRPALAALVK